MDLQLSPIKGLDVILSGSWFNAIVEDIPLRFGSPVPPREFTNYAPHAPQGPMAGQIIAMYGDALTGGQNQIVSLNRGAADGMERGHVLALWHAGRSIVDATDPSRPTIKLPDEKHGTLFVFRVFDRVSYALILSVQQPVQAGDRFTQP